MNRRDVHACVNVCAGVCGMKEKKGKTGWGGFNSISEVYIANMTSKRASIDKIVFSLLCIQLFVGYLKIPKVGY